MYKVNKDMKKTNSTIGKSILSFLPQSPNAIIRDTNMCCGILKFTYHSVNFLIEALDNFYIKHNYNFFDPHVGENACQIRAYIFLILSKKKNIHKITERINFLKKKNNQIIDAINLGINHKIKGKKSSIYNIYIKYDLYFDISISEEFLYKSYFLTIFKKIINIDFYIDKEYISKYFNISKYITKKITHEYQITLSEYSYNFIKKASNFYGINNTTYPNLFKNLLYNEGKPVFPCYFYSKIIFNNLLKNKDNLIIKIEDMNNKKSILFTNSNESNQLITLTNDTFLIDKVRMIVICDSESLLMKSPLAIQESLNRLGIYHILLMCMAAHPQYSGTHLSTWTNKLFPTDSHLLPKERELLNEFITYKEKAFSYGFCRENPLMLVVRHIFIDTLCNYHNMQTNHSFLKNNGEYVL